MLEYIESNTQDSKKMLMLFIIIIITLYGKYQ